jgi:UDP-glucose 4-epimerase
MSKCLVTGGAGFIGSHVARNLIEQGHRVIVIDDLSGGFVGNIPPRAEFIEGSITDGKLVDKVINENKVDYIFHLAAYAAEGLSHFIKRFNYHNNLIGSVNLINAAVNFGVRCFVFTSSIAVYGKGQLPMTEGMTPQPEDSYGIAKLAVEQELEISHEMFGLDYIIFRPHNVYGENQNIGDKYRNVIGIFMNQAMQGLPMTIFGDGEQTRAFSYISDVAPVIASSIEVPEAFNSIFNIGADTPYAINELADVVATHIGCGKKIKYLPARKEVVHAFSSHERVKAVFGHSPKWTLEEGISRMASWAQKVGPRRSKPFGEIEIQKNIPSSWN